MPLTRIEVRKKWPPAQQQAIIEAVCSAQCEALKLPEHDRQVRLIEHSADLFYVPPDKSENFTLVEISLFAGRSMDAKRALYKAIVSNLGTLGIAAADVFIVLNEIPQENWGIRGGVPASDVDLGFKVDV
jgi:phenylpyruvate tautomerase PptA (4-oxalocrotonate tautomerase family)